MRKLLMIVAALGLSGCTDTADLFPLNPEAKQIGLPTVSFVRTGFGFAPVTVTMPDGEILHGTAKPAFSGGMAVGFSGRHVATAMAVGDGNLQMVVRGPKSQILCRASVSALGGHGNGECETDNGALWAINF